jgi:type I restriction enzyme R subunit
VCGVVVNDRDPCLAAIGEHLSSLLAQHKSHIFSLIQKFKSLRATPSPLSPLPKVEGNRSLDATPSPGLGPPSTSGRGLVGEGRLEAITLRDDVIVITDEAHRTQYGTLALNLRNALPNAGYIGFTGTPLFTDDEITRRVFGNYVSTYDFQRAVEDKATVPLYYDARGDKLGVAVDDVNERIKAVAVDLIETLKAEKLRVDHWRDKEATRDAVRLAIRDFLWSESTGLPVDRYTENDVHVCADEVYRHVYRVYPTVPSPYYEACAAA